MKYPLDPYSIHLDMDQLYRYIFSDLSWRLLLMFLVCYFIWKVLARRSMKIPRKFVRNNDVQHNKQAIADFLKSRPGYAEKYTHDFYDKSDKETENKVDFYECTLYYNYDYIEDLIEVVHSLGCEMIIRQVSDHDLENPENTNELATRFFKECKKGIKKLILWNKGNMQRFANSKMEII